MISLKNVLKFGLSVFVTALLLCTIDKQTTGTVDDTETGIKAMVYLPDGKPAADAEIKFIASNRSQPTGLMKLLAGKAGISVVHTDQNGRYEIPKLPDSTYNVFMEKDSLKAFQGSVVVSEDGNTVHDDTLHAPGSFQAVVGLDPRDQHNVKSVTVQILGSDVDFVNPDKNGMFRFTDLAAGKYKLRLEINLSEYSPTFYDMEILSGVDSIFPDTIWLHYTGIPSVKGFSAEFDTSSGAVVLKWQPTDYGNLLDYVIYRDDDTSVSYSTKLFKATKDTFFIDTIYNLGKSTGQYSANDSTAYGYRYRIAIRNNSTEVGNTYGYISIKTAPYKSVIPRIDSLNISFDTAEGIADIRWSNSLPDSSISDYLLIRNIKSLDDSSFRNRTDTIVYISKSTFSDSLFNDLLSYNSNAHYEIIYSIAINRKDWRLNGIPTSAGIQIGPYMEIYAGDDHNVDFDSDILLQGKISGRILTNNIKSIEWKIGNENWLAADDSGRVHFHTSSDPDDEIIQCIFRVTDNMENVLTDTMNVTKTRLVVSFTDFFSGLSQGTATTFIESPDNNNTFSDSSTFQFIDQTSPDDFGLWSTSDFIHKKLLSHINVENSGQFFTYQNNYYCFNSNPDSGYKSYKSSDGITWTQLNQTFTWPQKPAFQSNVVHCMNSFFMMATEIYYDTIGRGGQYDSVKVKLLKSNDAVNWDTTSQNAFYFTDYYGKNDYKPFMDYNLFNLGDTLIIIINNKVFISTDNDQWQEFINNSNPYQPSGLTSNGSEAVTAYRNCVRVGGTACEHPIIKELWMYKNAEWSKLPVEAIGIDLNGFKYLFLIGKRCFVSINNEVKAFKLY